MKDKKEPSNDIIAENENQSNNDTDQATEIDSISDSLIQGMPPVSEHVVEQHKAEQEKIETENASTTDKRGDVFDPEIHATDDDGKPKFTVSGYFAKKRGRKSGTTKSELNTGGGSVNNEAQRLAAKQAMAGSAAANSLITLGIVLGGDEWQPIQNDKLGINEKQNLETAFSEYFKAKNMDDIPAGVALTIAISGYVLPRFTMPKTRQRSATLWTKIKAWFADRKAKKHNLKVVPRETSKEN